MRICTLSAYVFALLSSSGCEDLLSVAAPDVVLPEAYASPAGATAFAAGALTEFNRAFAQQVRYSGWVADELIAPQVFANPFDQRDATDPVEGNYALLSLSRQRLITAIRAFQQAAPDSGARIGQLFALVGYTIVLLEEHHCAGVPLSSRDAQLRPIFGQPRSAVELRDSALLAFDSALIYGADSARIVNFARVGRARTLLNGGRFAEAEQAVAGVPTPYTYDATYLGGSPGVPFNSLVSTVFNSIVVPRNLSIPEREGTNGINWRTANDPRSRLVNRSPTVMGDDGVTEIWQFMQYQALNSPIRLASGVEARLIEAEAALQASNSASWLSIHNGLRATVTGLAALTDPGTPAARVDLHFRERAFWLFLTAHRQGDLRRLVRQYGRDAESVFPTGMSTRPGVPYGNATNMALPQGELLNPNFAGCVNRDA